MTPRDTYPKTSQVWLDVISAVDYLSRGSRPGLTVYDALEEALRWQTAALIASIDDLATGAVAQLPWDDPDPLRTALDGLVAQPASDDSSTADRTIHDALATWTRQMAVEHNDGRRWISPVRLRSADGISPLLAQESRAADTGPFSCAQHS
jgi:hypothetical protein